MKFNKVTATIKATTIVSFVRNGDESGLFLLGKRQPGCWNGISNIGHNMRMDDFITYKWSYDFADSCQKRGNRRGFFLKKIYGLLIKQRNGSNCRKG